MSVKNSREDGFETQYLDSLSGEWPDNGLNQGAGFSDTINLGNNANSIVLIPIILGNSEGGEEKSFTCDEARYGKEIVL